MNSLFHSQAPRRLHSNTTALFTMFLLDFLRGKDFIGRNNRPRAVVSNQYMLVQKGRMATKGNSYLTTMRVGSQTLGLL